MTTKDPLNSEWNGLDPPPFYAAIGGDEAEVVHFTVPSNRIRNNPFAPQPSPSDESKPTDNNSETFRTRQYRKVNPPSFMPIMSDVEDEIEIEFKHKKHPAAPSNTDRQDSIDDMMDIDKLSELIGSIRESESGINQNGNNRRISTDSLNVAPPNSSGVQPEDLIFSLIIFASHLLSFVVDLTLLVWYYCDEGDVYNFKWCSALTFAILLMGSIGIWHRFNQVDKERLDRLFHHGRRVQILANAFPPMATILSSYYAAKSARRAKHQQTYSVQYFAIEEFSKSLSRVQGFYQSAPQAALQLVILMETMNEIGIGKGLLISFSILLSLIIMTIANLPGRSDIVDRSIRKGIHTPVSRIFLGTRMISSFGSRTMAIAYFFLGLRCLLGAGYTFTSVVIGLCVIIIPRIGFTFGDYCYHCQKLTLGLSNFGNLSFRGTWTGYMATIFFPMSHPLWIFWFTSLESVVFVLFGMVAILSSKFPSLSCVSTLVNIFYSGLFLLLFIFIPVILPYARATVKRRNGRRISQKFHQSDTGDDLDRRGITVVNLQPDTV